MKTLKYIGLFIASFMFAACAVDEMGSADAESLADNSPVVISISDKNMLPVDMMKTRAGVDMNTILSTVNDLNVRVNLKDNSVKFIYCTKSGVETNDAGASFIPNHELASMTATSPVQLHLDIIASQVQSVEVIANYGKAIAKDADWKGAKESEASPASGNALKEPALLPQAKNSISTMTCMMYGRADALADGSIHTDKATNTPCKYFDISLKRTRAIVTLKIIGTGLKEGVSITFKELRLYNTPKECVLTSLAKGKGNKINIPADVYGPMSTIVSLGTLTNGKKPGSVSQMGAHFDEVPTGQTAEWAFPMFMYENMQGTNPNVSGTAADKYPVGIKDVIEAKDPAKNFKASYLEVVGDYYYKKPKNDPTYNDKNIPNEVGGAIIYRFFLGSDILDDFNIEGNHYYKLTLNLKNFGGAKEDGKTDAAGNIVVNENDVSWRVDMGTKSWGFEKSQYDFDSHYTDGAVKVIGTNWKFVDELTKNGNNSWLVINVKNYTSDWANPTQIVNTENIQLNIVDGKLRFQVQPMFFGTEGIDPAGAFQRDDYLKKKNYREMKIVVQNTDTQDTTHITVRQYVPIPVDVKGGTVYMERFEEYNEDVLGFKWGWEGNNLSSLMDENKNSVPYAYGSGLEKNTVGRNTLYLTPKYDQIWDTSLNKWVDQLIPGTEPGIGTAAECCFQKGRAEYQGGLVKYYALPSEDVMKAMFDMSAKYDESWGPFEPLHIYQDYWTSTVPTNSKTNTIYYSAKDRSYVSTKTTDERKLIKRVRAVYTNQVY